MIEDNEADVRLLMAALRDTDRSFTFDWVDRLASGLERLRTSTYDCVLLDLTLPDSRGVETVSRCLQDAPQTPIVVLSGHAEREVAMAAVRAGAQDYLAKGVMDGAAARRAILYAIERNEAQRAAASSQARFRSISDNALDALLLLDATGRVTYANPAAERLTGHTAASLVGRDLSDLLVLPDPAGPHGGSPADARTPALAAYEGALIETELRTDIGEGVPVEASISWWQGDEGASHTVIIRDVRDRHAQERALAEQRHLLARAQEIAHVGSWDLRLPSSAKGSRDLRIHGSDEFRRILGLPPTAPDLSLDEFLSFLPDEHIASFEAALYACRNEGRPLDVEVRVERRDGSGRDVHLRAERAPRHGTKHAGTQGPDAAATLSDDIRILGAALDITDRKEAQRTLEENYREVAQNEKLAALGTLIAGVAHEINNPLAYVKSNEQILEMLIRKSLPDIQALAAGHSPTTPSRGIGRGMLHRWRRTGLDTNDADDANDEERNGSQKAGRHGNRRRSGPDRSTKAHTTPATDRPTDEELLNALSSSEALLRKASELLQTNRVGIDRIEAIVRSLRQVTRPSSADRVEVDLVEVVRDTLPVLEPVRRDRDVRLEFTSPHRMRLPVKVNVTEISQIVLNLTKNAIEASSDTAEVAVVVEPRDDGGAVVYVRDRGEGIADADLRRIFDPFFTTKANGTGLGLAICARMARAHGGTLTARNRAGGGAEFCLTLPSISEAPGPEQEQEQEQGEDPTMGLDLQLSGRDAVSGQL